MASTNKTTNLRLNQWEGSDPILRTDFNQDNSKIDQAVNARALVRLTGKTLTASGADITLDLLDYDLTQYEALMLTLAPITSGTGVYRSRGTPPNWSPSSAPLPWDERRWRNHIQNESLGYPPESKYNMPHFITRDRKGKVFGEQY